MFDSSILTAEDYDLAMVYLKRPAVLNNPDLILAPTGTPYLYRWHLTPPKQPANVMFHIQVDSDPERPLHDHPWDNQSVILSGGYEELITDPHISQTPFHWSRVKGDVICRRAHIAHRLILPSHIPYTMTLFTTGPKVREWGFWYPEGWVHNEKVTYVIGNVSYHKEQK